MSEDQHAAIAAIRENLLQSESSQEHVRIVGEPGVGKTRLAFEATNIPELRPLVLYTDAATRLLGSPDLVQLRRCAADVFVVLIVDECSLEARSRLRDIFKTNSSNIQIITIHNEVSESDSTAEYKLINLPKLTNEQTTQIIRDYGIDDEKSRFWSAQCDGSPRVAHVVGRNLVEYPEDVLREDGIAGVWRRYVAGNDAPDSENVRFRRIALCCLALFKRFGWEGNLRGEAETIRKEIIALLEPRISSANLVEIVKTLRRRKILQGESTLYITPKLLHIRLWRDWWNDFEASVPIIEIFKALPEQLQTWFMDMMIYAHESNAATAVVDHLLGNDGLFREDAFLKTELGSKFFFQLSQIRPTLAIERLSTMISSQSIEQLRLFSQGRRYTIHALEFIARDERLFYKAAESLLRLAEAENEAWSNNATGVFTELFGLGHGPLSATETPPEARLPVLDNAISSPNSTTRHLALKGFDASLQLRNIVRMDEGYGPGLRYERKEWRPEVWGEVFGAYKLYWKRIEGIADELPSQEERDEATFILLNHARELVHYPLLSKTVLSSLKNISQIPRYKRRLIETVVSILHYDSRDLPDEVTSPLRALVTDLEGKDFQSQLTRFVGLDLIEDKFDEEGNQTDQIAKDIARLADEAVSQPEKLEKNLSWLVTNEASNGLRFGKLLAERDAKFKLWPSITSAWKKADPEKRNLMLISGYLQGVFHRRKDAWENMLDALSQDEETRRYVLEATWRSGMTKQAAKRVYELVHASHIPPEELIFLSYGGTASQIPESVLNKILLLLLDKENINCAVAALELLSYLIYSWPKDKIIPKDIALNTLSNPVFFHAVARNGIRNMVPYNWANTATRLVRDHPDTFHDVLGIAIKNFHEENTIFSGRDRSIEEFLEKIIEQRPVEFWDTIDGLITPPLDSRALDLWFWLGKTLGTDDEKAPISCIPRDTIWTWVNADPKARAPLVARFVPKRLQDGMGKPTIARDLLAKYGDRPSVRRELAHNFMSGMWWGSASTHYTEKRDSLLKMRDTEDHKNVRLFIDELIEDYELMITSNRVREERDDF